MTIYERFDEMICNTEFDLENAKQAYYETEAGLVVTISELVKEAEVVSTMYGTGTVVSTQGKTIDDIIIDVEFPEVTKRFSLAHIISGNKFTKFTDENIYEIWNQVFNAHTNLTSAYKAVEQTMLQRQAEEKKKAEAEKKAEEKYQRQKAKALQDFDTLAKQANNTLSDADEFYYALGWLAKHVGSMTAILPDYLGPAFEKHFGTEAPKTLVDSRAKTSGGYAKQWSWEFKCTIKKLKETVVPACIQHVTTDFSKGIHNTAFLWDLVYNYGFQFGKKQNIDEIKQTIPNSYMASFEAGLMA